MHAILCLAFVAAILPPNDMKTVAARKKLEGMWRVVGTVNEDGKKSDGGGELAGVEIVITSKSMSMYLDSKDEKSVVWAADYWLDISKNPPVIRQTVTRAPCGNGKETEESYSFDRDKLILGGLILERARR